MYQPVLFNFAQLKIDCLYAFGVLIDFVAQYIEGNLHILCALQRVGVDACLLEVLHVDKDIAGILRDSNKAVVSIDVEVLQLAQIALLRVERVLLKGEVFALENFSLL